MIFALKFDGWLRKNAVCTSPSNTTTVLYSYCVYWMYTAVRPGVLCTRTHLNVGHHWLAPSVFFAAAGIESTRHISSYLITTSFLILRPYHHIIISGVFTFILLYTVARWLCGNRIEMQHCVFFLTVVIWFLTPPLPCCFLPSHVLYFMVNITANNHGF
jgi:hypothetical protein